MLQREAALNSSVYHVKAIQDNTTRMIFFNFLSQDRVAGKR